MIDRRHRGALITLVERKSLYTIIGAVCRKTVAAAREAVVVGLTPYKDRVRTLTYGNGRGLSDHEGIAGDLEARAYFAHPYAPWERG